ncbi:MAG: zinc ABC transporter substrate-binding protein [Rickettsiales bacterium]|jgi:zinc transport system substrate-binding protein|nr:zinc ABC transporter substrate-binding protein [Rickettsiales bacterium]
MRLLLILPCLLFISMPAIASGVVVSIKPIHSLVSAVMEGDTEQPQLLLSGKESLHSFSLKPSQVKSLAGADIVFYMSNDFELFMDKAIGNLNASVQLIQLANTKGLTLLPARMGEGFEAHEHGHEHHHEEDADHKKDAGHDFHLWMSPANAMIMVQEISAKLSKAYPAKQKLYETNAAKLVTRLETLDQDMMRRMEKLKNKPFIVFHDAYQYFEKRYGLSAAGSLTIHPERGLSARHMTEIREKIKHDGALCVFREPQFDSAIVDNLLAGTKAKSAVLDPEGALIAPGKELYFQLIEGIAGSLESCLAA